MFCNSFWNHQHWLFPLNSFYKHSCVIIWVSGDFWPVVSYFHKFSFPMPFYHFVVFQWCWKIRIHTSNSSSKQIWAIQDEPLRLLDLVTQNFMTFLVSLGHFIFMFLYKFMITFMNSDITAQRLTPDHFLAFTYFFTYLRVRETENVIQREWNRGLPATGSLFKCSQQFNTFLFIWETKKRKRD